MPTKLASVTTELSTPIVSPMVCAVKEFTSSEIRWSGLSGVVLAVPEKRVSSI